MVRRRTASAVAAGKDDMSTEPDLAEVRERARSALPEACAIAMHHFEKAAGGWEKGPGQIVTEADLAIDRLLHERLRRPGEAWLSEETADDGSRLEQASCWVVDPIDGTRSFAEGKPEFSICIGYLVERRPVFGIVANPATGEVFEAVVGRGAFLDGRRLEPLADVEVARPRIAASRTEVKKRPLAWLAPDAVWTMLGSLALKLVFVAAKRFDAYVTLRRTNDWDIAAADVILQEVGVQLVDPSGQRIRYDRQRPSHPGLIAAPPRLRDRMVGRIAQTFPVP
jgi:myo-inositol-1(or 4)-monophosphatase